jgi:long-chain acyl-CoA synthetase
LKLVTYGTEPMPEATLARAREAMPWVDFQQTYGLTEIGILRSKSRPDGSLWVKLGGEGYETKIKDQRLWVRAASAMLGYLNAPSPFDAEGFLDTGDLVEVDGEWLRILGRQDDRINVGGEKVHPTEVENVLLQMPNVVDAVVFGQPHPLMGQIVAARLSLASPEAPAAVKARVRAFCGTRLAGYKVPLKVAVADTLHSARFKRMRRPQH